MEFWQIDRSKVPAGWTQRRRCFSGSGIRRLHDDCLLAFFTDTRLAGDG